MAPNRNLEIIWIIKMHASLATRVSLKRFHHTRVWFESEWKGVAVSRMFVQTY